MSDVTDEACQPRRERINGLEDHILSQARHRRGAGSILSCDFSQSRRFGWGGDMVVVHDDDDLLCAAAPGYPTRGKYMALEPRPVAS